MTAKKTTPHPLASHIPSSLTFSKFATSGALTTRARGRLVLLIRRTAAPQGAREQNKKSQICI